MSKGTTAINYLLVALLTFALGFYMGGAGCGEKGEEVKKAEPVKKVEMAKPMKKGEKEEERFKIPLGKSYFKGEKNAMITIVEFSEFQCPFCNRVNPTIKKIMDEYKGQVKIVFKHNPLPFHKDAFPASEAALAAGAQGKFWEMHDKMFENTRALQRENLDKFAKELGLDVNKFKTALDNHTYKAEIEADQELAKNFQARGTPHLFINGIRLRGAQPFERFKAVIDRELMNAKKFSGAKDIYAELVKGAKTKAIAKKKPDKQRKEDKNVYKVSLPEKTKNFAKGNKDGALITIMEFSEFQCPFCKRVNPTIEKIMKEYEGKVRVMFRHNPLPFHKDALPASKAAIAAGNQGKFWEMHDKIFENQRALKEENLMKLAGELGLNMAKFKKDFTAKETEEIIKADQAEAQKFGARGTPGFFINGRKIVGAQPFENFKKLIDELLPTAKKVGKKGDALYAALIKNGKDKAEAPPRRPQEDPNKVYKVPAGNSYWKGAKNAPVEIIEFSEFQCPFCSRVNPTIEKIMKEYKGSVKVVFKHNPLPFHKDAQLASEAALAAGEQGKFWEMHDKMFENQKALKRDNLEKIAQELGLNLDKFKKALDSGAYKTQVDDDKKLAAKVGARGTPGFYINGKKLSGAQPFENFKKVIDAALADKKKK